MNYTNIPRNEECEKGVKVSKDSLRPSFYLTSKLKLLKLLAITFLEKNGIF